MNINEKLKIASLRAEQIHISDLPDDSEILWEPSADFERKLNADIDRVLSEKKHINFRRRIVISLFAAMFALIAIIPVYMNLSDSDVLEPSIYGDSSNSTATDKNDSVRGDGSNTVSFPITDAVSEDERLDSNESLVTEDVLGYLLAYLPEGYACENVSEENGVFAATYGNGSESFTLYRYSGYFNSDIPNTELNSTNYNSNTYYNGVPFHYKEETQKDPSADAYDPVINIFPEEVKYDKNNIVWNTSDGIYALMGNSTLSAEEMQKIAAGITVETE